MIRSRTVRGPGPTTWTIRRRWASRPRWHWRLAFARWRALGRKGTSGPGWLGFPVGMGDGFIGWFLITFLLIGFIFFMAFIGWPLLVLLVDTFLIIPVTFVLGVAGRLLFGRPWKIEAAVRPPAEPKHVTWDVVGWRASEAAAGWMAASIRTTGDVESSTPIALRERSSRRAVSPLS